MPTGRGSVRRGCGGVFLALRRRRRRVPFRERARRSAGRFALALAVVLFAPALAAPLQAQAAGANQLALCLAVTRPPAFNSGGNLAPDAPPREGGMIAPNSMVIAALGCAEAFANNIMVPIGLRLLRGLAIIITIWTGIQMMFGGGFAIGEVVSLVLLIGFPLAVLSWYAATVVTPWGNFSFVGMVSGMGRMIGENLVTGVFKTLSDTLTDTWNKIWRSGTARDAVGVSEGWFRTSARGTVTFDGGLGEFVRFFRNTLQSLQFSFMVIIVVGLLIIPAVVAYCSYLWAYLSLFVATILGPLLIPWVLVPQLQFLAWGWFRAVLGAGVHMMVAGACFAVAAQILMIPLVRFGTLVVAGQDEGALSSETLLAASPLGPLSALVESLPLILVAYLGVFKIGEITAMIMNGGSMPSSGLGERIGSMQTMVRMRGALARGGASAAGMGGAAGAGRAALAATGVGAAAVAAGAVLSQATRSKA